LFAGFAGTTVGERQGWCISKEWATIVELKAVDFRSVVQECGMTAAVESMAQSYRARVRYPGCPFCFEVTHNILQCPRASDVVRVSNGNNDAIHDVWTKRQAMEKTVDNVLTVVTEALQVDITELRGEDIAKTLEEGKGFQFVPPMDHPCMVKLREGVNMIGTLMQDDVALQDDHFEMLSDALAQAAARVGEFLDLYIEKIGKTVSTMTMDFGTQGDLDEFKGSLLLGEEVEEPAPRPIERGWGSLAESGGSQEESCFYRVRAPLKAMVEIDLAQKIKKYKQVYSVICDFLVKSEGEYSAVHAAIKHAMDFYELSRPVLPSGLKRTVTQRQGDLMGVYHEAVLAHNALQEEAQMIASRVGGRLLVAGPKKISRILEKGVLCYNGCFERVLDMARTAIEVSTVDQMRQCLDQLMKSQKLNIVRIKDRFESPTAGGWSDLQVNVEILSFNDRDAKRNRTFVDSEQSQGNSARHHQQGGPTSPASSGSVESEPFSPTTPVEGNPNNSWHIGEVQIVHRYLMLVRQNMGAHHEYSQFRSESELLEAGRKRQQERRGSGGGVQTSSMSFTGQVLPPESIFLPPIFGDL